MLKDAGLTAFVAAALGIFVVGFRTYDASGTGLQFDYQFVDLGIAIVTIFVGRLGLLMAAEGQRWPALILGAAMGGLGASPVRLPSEFLHWFMALGGVLIIVRTIWPWANHRFLSAGQSPRGRMLRTAGTKWFGWMLIVA
ncbi:MAG TPA: DUF3382 domain-containing protein, partial [Reyranella sp.]|nr:DUF3382 domain-containing protein [Reyranella sp.]